MKLASLLSATLLLCLARRANCDICTRCVCPDQKVTQIIDCSRLTIPTLPASDDYPASLTNTSSDPVLTILDFSTNNIAAITQFPNLHSVVVLSFRHNNIKDIAESAFFNLEDLKKLDLSHNELPSEAIRADVFRGRFDNARYEPLNVETLDLGYNQIHSLSAKAFEHLPELVELHLNNNPLKIIDAPTGVALGTPQKLEILNLGYTELSAMPDELMHTLKGLKELYLQGNQFEKIPETLAAVGSTLERLNFNDNTMTSLDSNSFLGLANLKELNISNCQNLSEVGPATFAQLARLELLFMSFNFRLEYLDKDAFRELKDAWPIKQIHLKHNALSDISSQLLPWDDLEVLDLQENPWRCDCQLDWMVKDLLPKMIKNYPDYTQELRCHEPEWLRDTQLSFAPPTSMDNSSSCTIMKPRDLRTMAYPLHMFVVSIVFMTIVVFSIAMTILVRNEVWKKRHRFTSQEVAYSKQEDDEVFSI